VRFAFRRFGTPGATLLLMLQHFRGNLDNWDPALTDALARERELILVDYPGVGGGFVAQEIDGNRYSRFIIARASNSRSTNCSPEISTTACLIVPPVNAKGLVPA
jgi:hypothetical protein